MPKTATHLWWASLRAIFWGLVDDLGDLRVAEDWKWAAFDNIEVLPDLDRQRLCEVKIAISDRSHFLANLVIFEEDIAGPLGEADVAIRDESPLFLAVLDGEGVVPSVEALHQPELNLSDEL